MATDPRTRHLNFDWMEPARQVRIHVDQDEARRRGISSRTLAAQLTATVTGSAVTQVRDDIYLVNVVARATDAQRASLSTLTSLQVPTPGGRMVRSASSRRSSRNRSPRSSGAATACRR